MPENQTKGSATCQRNEKWVEMACHEPAKFVVHFGPDNPTLRACQVHGLEAAGMGLEVTPFAG